MMHIQDSKKTKSIINFLHFFNLKMFRYALFKQLKSASSYVIVILMILITSVYLFVLFYLENKSNPEAAQGNVIIFKFAFFLNFFPFFIMLIAFKSVQMVRDEIDDGTLLIFNSMSYTRTRMIIEKWLSLQIVCLFYSLIVISLPISFGFLISQVNSDANLNFKTFFSFN